jgi:hypothetical protein
MPVRHFFVTPKTTATTHGITHPSGPSTDESSRRAETLLGELDSLLADDPYWGICVRLWRLLSRKRGYYGCGQNPLENALGVAEEGIEPWVYQLARIGEKCRRLRGLMFTDRTIAIDETLFDIAGHAVVGIACHAHVSGEDPDESEADPVAACQPDDAPQDR